jgi:hypothetical protein
VTEVLLTAGTSWTVPDDCTSATVECIGGGQGGNDTNGGAGGDYAKASNLALTPGDAIAVQIGAGGAGVASGTQNNGGDTEFGTAVLAKGGGSASADIGDVTFAGGAGDAQGAGGGAAGPSGAGGAASGTTGGTGDAGATAAGADGTEWGTAGSGGGANAAGTGPELVRAFPFTFTDFNATTIPFDVAVKAGDKVVLLIETSAQRTVSNLTNPAGTPWEQDAAIQGVNSTYAECWSADITEDAASWQPVLTPNANGFFHLTLYLVRGKTLVLDTANVVTNSQVVTGAQTVTIGPYSTSGPAMVFLALRTFCNTGTGQVTVSDSDFTTDHTDLFSSRNSYTEAHAAFDAAQSNNTLNVTTSAGNTTVSRLIVPYTYT